MARAGAASPVIAGTAAAPAITGTAAAPCHNWNRCCSRHNWNRCCSRHNWNRCCSRHNWNPAIAASVVVIVARINGQYFPWAKTICVPSAKAIKKQIAPSGFFSCRLLPIRLSFLSFYLTIKRTENYFNQKKRTSPLRYFIGGFLSYQSYLLEQPRLYYPQSRPAFTDCISHSTQS